MRTFIGVDNGVSGSVAILTEQRQLLLFCKTPTFSQQNYTKAKANVTRVNALELRLLLWRHCQPPDHEPMVFLERPMVNPGRFQATASALRALEATLITVEMLKWPLIYCDSREWQKLLLPQGCKGPEELKRASRDIGCRLFPSLSGIITKHGDADSILIAEWARRNNL